MLNDSTPDEHLILVAEGDVASSAVELVPQACRHPGSNPSVPRYWTSQEKVAFFSQSTTRHSRDWSTQFRTTLAFLTCARRLWVVVNCLHYKKNIIIQLLNQTSRTVLLFPEWKVEQQSESAVADKFFGETPAGVEMQKNSSKFRKSCKLLFFAPAPILLRNYLFGKDFFSAQKVKCRRW